MRTDPRYRQVLAVYRASTSHTCTQPKARANYDSVFEAWFGSTNTGCTYKCFKRHEKCTAHRSEPGSTSSLSNNAEAAHDALNFPLEPRSPFRGRPHCV